VKKAGVDLDGVLTNFGFLSMKYVFPWFFYVLLFLIPPNRKMVEALRKWKNLEWFIYIISARPKQGLIKKITLFWLKIHEIPFDYLVLVGAEKGIAKRKLNAIKKAGVIFFIDDDEHVVEFLRVHGVKNAFLHKDKKGH